ncbi:DUF3080 family protein [Marinobacter zhejiangensis]|uniref:DUF3080 domain-containing protein n=1 Tax=Marinobacter zhejiangensis TaxID=488535 RepID=A0A1I4R9K1_9GAMM|nr:DUF3080 family protein [Marinobacter zhejiangensis]SFM48988.1 Protein of unknown function [Marinobacter zhejiangensis]
MLTMLRTLTSVLVAVSMVLLSGCNPFSEAQPMMDEYVERVARVLELNYELDPVTIGQQIPRRRYRRLDLPEQDINMLDFLSLYGCDLQYVVGERNSVMGKVMQPLNRLRYEQRFIVAARACLPEIEAEDLQVAVQAAIDSKIANLPLAYWNASWGTEGMESLVTFAKGPLPVDAEPDAMAQLVSDLNLVAERLETIQDGDYLQPLDDLGEVHQRWQNTHSVGQLIVSAYLLIHRLDDASQLIDQRVDGQPLCFQGKAGSQAKLAQGVLFNVYGKEVQPYLARVQRFRDAVIPAMARLADMQSPVMPQEVRNWYQRYLIVDQPGSLWGDLDAAMARHTRSWQTLMQQCGLMPASADFQG